MAAAPDGLKIEPARPLDALPTLALHRLVLDEDRWFLTTSAELQVTLQGREDRIVAAADDDHSVFLVARLPGVRCAGYLTIQPVPLERLRHAGKLEVMVHPDHRGQGVGRALVEAGLAWAEAGPLTKVGLAVFADNERALRLYRALGFVEEGRRPREIRLRDGSFKDDVLMYRFV